MTLEREDKLRKIVDAIGGGGALGLTRSEIAEALGIKKSPYLLELINQVVASGFAVQEFYQNCYPPRYVYYRTNKELEAHE